MTAPPILLICSALFGMAVPIAIVCLTFWIDNSLAVGVIQLTAAAVVPILVAQVAYRKGRDRALAAHRTPSGPTAGGQ